MARPLDPAEKTTLAANHPGWTLSGETISRTFGFADFAAAMGFVTRVGLAAEKADHHPDIDIRWNKVTLNLTTHSVGGKLSDKDQALVETIDGWGAP
jgi:4a-hydroxytetrahydrobiopterin dehydratase